MGTRACLSVFASFLVKGGNGIWVDLGRMGEVDRIEVGNSKGNMEYRSRSVS